MTTSKRAASPRPRTLTLRFSDRELADAQRLAKETDQSIARIVRALLAEACTRSTKKGARS